jgi:hypothetical protein
MATKAAAKHADVVLEREDLPRNGRGFFKRQSDDESRGDAVYGSVLSIASVEFSFAVHS